MKWLLEIKDKVISGVLIALLCSIGVGLWTYGTTFIQMPDEIQTLKVQHRMDSIKIARLDSVAKIHDTFIQDDWYVLKIYARELGLEEPQTVINNR